MQRDSRESRLFRDAPRRFRHYIRPNVVAVGMAVLELLEHIRGVKSGEIRIVSRRRNLSRRGEAGQITVFGKNGRTRSIALPAPLWSELMTLRGKARWENPGIDTRTASSSL
ncbi:MAG TPA: hypothetical protein VH302_02730 [Bryobacteraceae bacterium]|nr:hypothetical protein [Bryobacteraceae bacterium]